MNFNPTEGLNGMERVAYRVCAAGNDLNLAFYEIQGVVEWLDGDELVKELLTLIEKACKIVDVVTATVDSVGIYCFERYHE